MYQFFISILVFRISGYDELDTLAFLMLACNQSGSLNYLEYVRTNPPPPLQKKALFCTLNNSGSLLKTVYLYYIGMICLDFTGFLSVLETDIW